MGYHGTNGFLDPKYDGLPAKEIIRQVYRDNLLDEQTQALKDQAEALKKQQENMNNHCSSSLDNKIAKEIRLARERESHEKAYIDSLWAGYNDLKEEIDNLKTRAKTYLYGSDSYNELQQLIKEKEIKLDTLKSKTELKVTRYYENKLNQDKRIKANEVKESLQRQRQYDLDCLFTHHISWLISIVFLGSVVGLPIAYFIDIQTKSDITPIVLYSIIGYAILNIVSYFIKKSYIKIKWKSRKKRV